MRDREIANLHAAFTWDLDDFKRGTGEIDAGLKALLDRAGDLSRRFRTIGRDMTLGITAPIAGITSAIGAMSKSSADELKAMSNSAELAGESMDRFQRQAHAARSVSIEVEKLGDIFKDTREKIGDFAATGGGEMADFFENVAPKVGVTADMFRDLSGKDALQLYYDSLVQANVSQEEMVFYMESIADEATALLPLLAANGAEFRRLGEEANVFSDEDLAALLRYREGLREIGIAMDRIVIAAVQSGLIDVLTDLAKAAADWIRSLADTNPEILRFAGYVAVAFAALGPLIAVLTTAAMVVLPLFLARLSPVFLVLSALINPLGTLVVMIGKLLGGFGTLAGVGGSVLSVLGRILVIAARLHPVSAALVTVFTLFGSDVVEALGRLWDKAQEALGPALQRMFDAIVVAAAELRMAFDRIAESPLGQFIGQLLGLLGDLVGALVEIAGSAVIFAFETVLNLITALADLVADTVRVVTLLLQGDWANAWDAAGAAVANVIDNMAPSFERLFGWIYDALAALGLLEQRQKAAANFEEGVSKSWDELVEESGGRPRSFGTPYTLPANSRSGGGRARSAGPKGPSEEELAERREELRLAHELEMARASGDIERIRALERQRDLKRRIADYEDAGLKAADAQLKAEQELTELEIVRRDAMLDQLTADQLREQLQEARIRGDHAAVRSLEQELFLEEEIADLMQRGLEAAQAEEIALDKLLRLENARADAIERRLQEQEAARQIELARLRGDDPEAIRQMEERERYYRRIDELRRDGDLSLADAEEQAFREATDRSRAHLQGTFRDTFRGGLQAAMDGDLGSFFERWMHDHSFNALARVLDKLADRLADLAFGGGGGGGGLFDIIGSALGFAGGSKGPQIAGQVSSPSLALHSGGLEGLPGFNTGGTGRFGGIAGIDRNVLSLNGRPFARVSRGEVFDVRPANQTGQTSIVELYLKTDMLDERITKGAVRVVNQAAPAIGAASRDAAVARFNDINDNRFE